MSRAGFYCRTNLKSKTEYDHLSLILCTGPDELSNSWLVLTAEFETLSLLCDNE